MLPFFTGQDIFFKWDDCGWTATRSFVRVIVPLPFDPKERCRMSPQEIERTIEFILHHEARIAVNLERHGEQLRLLVEIAQVQSQRLDRHDDRLAKGESLLDRLAELLSRQDERLAKGESRLERLEELIRIESERLNRFEERL